MDTRANTKKQQKQEDEKPIMQFFESLTWIKNKKEFREFAELEGAKIRKIAVEMGLSGQGALEEPLAAIYSKVYSYASENPDLEPESQAEFAVTRSLDYFEYIRHGRGLESLMRDMQFEAAAKGEQGVEVYLDGKKLLPPGKHRNGYSVGITSDKDNEATKV